MKRHNLIFKVKITAGLNDLAYRTGVIRISGVSCANHALQIAIYWAELFWYPDWLMIEVSQVSTDNRSINKPMCFHRQFLSFKEMKAAIQELTCNV